MLQEQPASALKLAPAPPAHYFGPRIFHDVPDCREVSSETALSSCSCCLRRCPSLCATPARLFLSLTGIAFSLALIAAVLLIVGSKFSMTASSIAGLVTMATGAVAACLAVCLWLSLLCRPCCLCRRRSVVGASATKFEHTDRDAIVTDEAGQAQLSDCPGELHLQQRNHSRFRPPSFEPVYGQQSERADGDQPDLHADSKASSSYSKSYSTSNVSTSSGSAESDTSTCSSTTRSSSPSSSA